MNERPVHHWPLYGLLQLPVTVFFTLALLSIGVFGLGGGPGASPVAACCSNASMVWVFAAAPFRLMRIFPRSFKFGRLNDPPAYVNSESAKTQSWHSSPSSGTKVPWLFPIVTPFIRTEMGGIGGSDLPPNNGMDWGADCARVGVWLNNNDPRQAPTTNDKNAIVTLDITPSKNGANCAVWQYHYGKAPPKTVNPRRKIVPPTPKRGRLAPPASQE